MKRGFLFTPAARRDLDNIWTYTCQNWNEDQADRYVLPLVAAVKAASSGNRKGRSCDEIRPGYFRITSGSHVIFYKMTNGTLDVVRILHRRMDFNRHF